MTASLSKPLWVRWWPAQALDGMTDLTATEELAYRRILDLIFKSDDRLRDDDTVMPTATKTGRQWRAVKAALVAKGKIEVGDGFIRNARATATCSETRDFRAQKAAAAAASHQSPKRLKNKKSGPAGADAVADTFAYAGATARQQLSSTPPPKPPKQGRAAKRELPVVAGRERQSSLLPTEPRSPKRDVLAKESILPTGPRPVPDVPAGYRRGYPFDEIVPLEANGYIVEKVFDECCDILDVGDQQWERFRSMLVEMLRDGAKPDHIHAAMRDVRDQNRQRGLGWIESAGFFKAKIRNRMPRKAAA